MISCKNCKYFEEPNKCKSFTTRAMMMKPGDKFMEFYPLEASNMKLVEDLQFCMGLSDEEMEAMKK